MKTLIMLVGSFTCLNHHAFIVTGIGQGTVLITRKINVVLTVSYPIGVVIDDKVLKRHTDRTDINRNSNRFTLLQR